MIVASLSIQPEIEPFTGIIDETYPLSTSPWGGNPRDLYPSREVTCEFRVEGRRSLVTVALAVGNVKESIVTDNRPGKTHECM